MATLAEKWAANIKQGAPLDQPPAGLTPAEIATVLDADKERREVTNVTDERDEDGYQNDSANTSHEYGGPTYGNRRTWQQ